jgi:hypothetical protein
MQPPTGSSSNSSNDSTDEWVGPLRVCRVRLVVGSHRTTAFVEGYRHHRAVVERIPLARATQLTARGVPVTLEHRRHDAA